MYIHVRMRIHMRMRMHVRILVLTWTLLLAEAASAEVFAVGERSPAMALAVPARAATAMG